MHPQLKNPSINDLAKFLCLAMITLFGLNTSFGQTSASPAASLQESFRGTLQQEPNSDKDEANSPSIVFVESNSGEKYSTITHQSFYRLVPQREYILNGIVVRKHLPDKAISSDYMQLVQSAWPDMETTVLKYKAKKVEDSINKNPKKSLVLVCSLRKADSPSGQRRNQIKIDGNIQKPSLIKRVTPVYPDAAKAFRIMGQVILQVTIDEEGNVEEITTKSGDWYLVAAAIEAVQQWKFSPVFIGGSPASVIVTVEVMFSML